jgi:hypothetical protein
MAFGVGPAICTWGRWAAAGGSGMRRERRVAAGWLAGGHRPPGRGLMGCLGRGSTVWPAALAGRWVDTVLGRWCSSASRASPTARVCRPRSALGAPIGSGPPGTDEERVSTESGYSQYGVNSRCTHN